MRKEEIYLSVEDDIGWVVLNRPERRNAITAAMWEALLRLLVVADADRAVKVLVLRGAGTEAFAVGADLADVGHVANGTADPRAYLELYGGAQRALAEFRKPTIAMIHGYCIGAGCGIATACDFRWADVAARFGVPAAKMGQVYRLEETRRLVRLIGAARAKAMLYTGGLFGAADAQRFGLADEIRPADTLEAETKAFANAIAGVSQFSVQSMKRVFRAIDSGQSRDDETTTGLFLEALHGEDYREGLAALKEKRPPRFTFR